MSDNAADVQIVEPQPPRVVIGITVDAAGQLHLQTGGAAANDKLALLGALDFARHLIVAGAAQQQGPPIALARELPRFNLPNGRGPRR